MGRKAYKDAIWFRARRQPGEELRAVRGGLTGPAGLINDATVQYLREESTEVDFAEGTARSLSRPAFVDAIAPRSGGGDGEREGDSFVWETEAATPLGADEAGLDAWVRPPALDAKDRSSLRETVRRTFDVRELAVLHAFRHGIPLSDKTLCACCGLGKSRVSLLFKERIPGKVRRLVETPGLPVDFDTSSGMRELFLAAEEILRGEPAFAPLLSLAGGPD